MAPEYNAIPSATPFSRTTNSSIFTLTPNAWVATQGGIGPLLLTALDIATQKLGYDKLIHQYNEVQAVELVLRKQIIIAIYDKYIQALRSPITDTVH